MKRLIEKILGKFKYVKWLEEDRARYEKWYGAYFKKYTDSDNELRAAVEHCKQKQERIVTLEHDVEQLEIENTYMIQVQESLETHLEEANAKIMQLADELLAYRQGMTPSKPGEGSGEAGPIVIVRGTLVEGPAPLQAWRCPCGITHAFHEVSCGTCSRTRPPRASSPSQPSV